MCYVSCTRRCLPLHKVCCCCSAHLSDLLHAHKGSTCWYLELLTSHAALYFKIHRPHRRVPTGPCVLLQCRYRRLQRHCEVRTGIPVPISFHKKSGRRIPSEIIAMFFCVQPTELLLVFLSSQNTEILRSRRGLRSPCCVAERFYFTSSMQFTWPFLP